MVACTEMYRYWAKKGNFCGKSESVARQIEEHIEYVDKYKLEPYEINRNALRPFIVIEEYTMVHNKALNDLKKKCRKIGGRNITKRHSLEIIAKANSKVPEK